MEFSSDMVFRSGTDKPFPYRVQAQKPYRHNFNAPLKCLPLEGKVSAQPTDEVFFSSAGRAFALNQHNFTGCETLWFVPLSRYRASAISVSVQCPCASKKLCKGRWVGLGRAGGVVIFKSVRHRRTHSLFIIHSQAQPAPSGCRNKCIRKGSVRQ